MAAVAVPRKDHMLITTIKSYSTKNKALEEKSLGWLLGWWLQAAPSSACKLSQGWLGLHFLAGSVALGETGDGWVSGCEEKAAVRVTARVWITPCHSSCQPWLPGLPAPPSMTPVCLGTVPLGMLAFPARQPRFWGMCVIYMLNIVAKEEFNPSLGRSTSLCLNCTNILL